MGNMGVYHLGPDSRVLVGVVFTGCFGRGGVVGVLFYVVIGVLWSLAFPLFLSLSFCLSFSLK